MKISLQWIQDFVDIADQMNKPAELAELLTRAGLEVEEIVDRRKDFDAVVTGLILEKDKHPGADRLTVCKVTTGEGVVHQIVCGATNHKAGDRVVVALPGAVLPGNFTIKRSAIRGVESGGMLCSTTELGLSKESDGILILPADAPVGKPFAEYMGLTDVQFELKVTPNRADCLSHYGLAREIACLLGRELKTPAPSFTEAPESSKSTVALHVEATDLCPRYVGRVIKGVKVGDSPDWLKRRLESVGLNSINNVVDVTNYVMMELGQPLHAFDAARIAGKKIVVDRAPAGEKFTTLDGTEIAMKGGELVIRDGERIVALAGVVGGKNSGVTNETADLFLESANFLASSVRKTSRAHGIVTDSAYRFSRGVDPRNARKAQDRAVELIVKVAGGTVLSDPHDSNPSPTAPKPIDIGLEYVGERLGYAADAAKFADFMKRLGCGLESTGEKSYRVTPPSFRFDLERDVDLVEEYARLNGYDEIPESIPVVATAPAPHDEKWRLLRRVHGVLRGQGYLQAFNYGFTSSKRERAFLGGMRAFPAAGLAVGEKSIALKNPLADDLDVMRSTVCEGLYRNAVANTKYGNEEGFLYEIASTFHHKDGGGYRENTRLALIGWGRPRSLFTKSAQYPVVFDLKAAVEALLEMLRIGSFTWVVPADKGEVPGFCHRGQYAQLMVEGKKVGFIGTVHPSLLEEEKIRVPMAISELDVEALLKGQPRPYRAEALSKFPAVERDYSFVVPKSLRIADVLKEIRKAVGALLVEADVFDVYEGDKMEAGKKSVSLRLVFQDRNATLQEAQINELNAKVLEAVGKAFGIAVR